MRPRNVKRFSARGSRPELQIKQSTYAKHDWCNLPIVSLAHWLSHATYADFC